VSEKQLNWVVTEHRGRKGEFDFESPDLRRQIEERVQAHAAKIKETSGVVIFDGFSVEWRIGSKP
jgi:hypothetical protein